MFLDRHRRRCYLETADAVVAAGRERASSAGGEVDSACRLIVMEIGSVPVQQVTTFERSLTQVTRER
jgi:hypothetical protein